MTSTLFITGATSGFGEACARRFAQAGWSLVLTGRREERLNALCAELSKQTEVHGLVLDVRDRKAMESAIANLPASFGKLRGLINNAGILRDGLLVKVKDGEMTKMSLAQWQAVIDVNLTGVFLCTREVAAKMVELKNSGAIINISSISRAGNVGQTNYSAAKAGVAAATVTWAKELARYGIRVAGIAPGFIETEMTLGMKPEALEKMTSGIPLKRMGKPEEIAHSAAYIFENDYYTGRILEMDGGLRI